MAGHGSTFGLKSVDLSRAFFLRQFRDFVLQRVAGGGVVLPPQEDLVLIGLRTVGAAGGSVVHDLCGSARDALKRLPQYASFRVECFVPSDLTFEEEIRQVQRAKVLVSVHGTISYMALFTRDGTQQISVASPKELKENQILLYATHVNTLYLTWNRLDELPGLLLHALSLSDAFHQA
ncbi:hypothetical protein B484DRAFT_258750 [Ochromonadaceae sp. CCMP2298]|nr:hypothetical protein B484DRAFT_258750 [Ochromonadaceae sp. CCMP2298]